MSSLLTYTVQGTYSFNGDYYLSLSLTYIPVMVILYLCHYSLGWCLLRNSFKSFKYFNTDLCLFFFFSKSWYYFFWLTLWTIVALLAEQDSLMQFDISSDIFEGMFEYKENYSCGPLQVSFTVGCWHLLMVRGGFRAHNYV